MPAGFTITTEACVAYMRGDRVAPEGLEEAIDEALARLEAQAGRRLGDPADPLLLSVRSGARDSMPGMMDTVLNLGLNDESVQGLAASTGNARFAWDSYRRLVQMFGNVVCGVPGERFEEEIARAKRARGVTLDTELDADALQELTRRFQSLYDFPTDPREQLRARDRGGLRLLERRPRDRLPAHQRHPRRLGHRRQRPADGVRQPRPGARAPASRSRATRSPARPSPAATSCVDAQGEDVVSGVRTPLDLAELRSWKPEIHAQLLQILRTLERHYGDMQDTEFTVEEGRLYMLQTRNAKRAPQAAVRFAADAVEEGLLTPRRRRSPRSTPSALDALLHPTFDPDARVRGRRPRRGRLAGRREGAHRLHRPGRGRGRRGGDRRSSSCARSPRPTTSPASTPPRASSPRRAARPRTPRSWRAAWAGPR